MEIKGKVVQVLPIESGTSKKGNEWTRSSVVIETEGKYPKKVMLTSFKDAAGFANISVGTEGTFHVDVESHEWTSQNTGRTTWFTELNCWKWEGAAQPSESPSGQANWQAVYPQPKEQPPLPSGTTDDLPF